MAASALCYLNVVLILAPTSGALPELAVQNTSPARVAPRALLEAQREHDHNNP